EALVEHRQEELLLALEVRVERPLGEAGVLGHLVDGGLLEATAREHLRGRLHQAGARVRLLLLAAQPAWHQAAAWAGSTVTGVGVWLRRSTTTSVPRSGLKVIVRRTGRSARGSAGWIARLS